MSLYIKEHIKAQVMKCLRKDECGGIVIRLGEFHLLITFLRVIGQHMAESGLTEFGLYTARRLKVTNACIMRL